MEVSASNSSDTGKLDGPSISVEQVKAFLDTLDHAVVLSDREGVLLATNVLAVKCLEQFGLDGRRPLNVLRDLLQVDP